MVNASSGFDRYIRASAGTDLRSDQLHKMVDKTLPAVENKHGNFAHHARTLS